MEEYKIEEVILDLGPHTYTLFQISNIDEVFDAMLSLPADNVIKHDERIPYWTEIWPSAIALSRFIGDHPDLIQDKKTLELGAGLGLPSLVAARFTKQLVCSDYLEDALVFAEKNALRNGIHHIQYACIDWRNLNNGAKYDVILASDIAYERRFFEDLPGAFKSLMHEKSVVLLSEPGRHFTAAFIEELSNHFDIKSYPLPQTWRGTHFSTSVHVLTVLT